MQRYVLETAYDITLKCSLLLAWVALTSREITKRGNGSVTIARTEHTTDGRVNITI